MRPGLKALDVGCGFAASELAPSELVANVSNDGRDCRRHNNNIRLDTSSVQNWIRTAIRQQIGGTQAVYWTCRVPRQMTPLFPTRLRHGARETPPLIPAIHCCWEPFANFAH